MPKVIAMGECLIDFIPNEGARPLAEVESFIKRAGGAPANVACQVAKLGGKAVFLGAFAKDGFADFLKRTLKDCNVELYPYITDKANTSLAFVTLQENGEREFNFFRNPGADMMLDTSFIRDDMFDKNDILHFCSVCLCDCPTEKAHEKAVRIAIDKGCLVSFDVNLRLPLWKNEDDLKRAVYKYLPYADIVKMSDEELFYLTAEDDFGAALDKMLIKTPKASLFFITLGGNGSICVIRKNRTVSRVEVNAVKHNAVDMTGAGDSYIGCILYRLTKEGGIKDETQLREIMNFASEGAGLTVTKKGAIEALPYLHEIEKSIKNKSKLNQ